MYNNKVFKHSNVWFYAPSRPNISGSNMICLDHDGDLKTWWNGLKVGRDWNGRHVLEGWSFWKVRISADVVLCDLKVSRRIGILPLIKNFSNIRLIILTMYEDERLLAFDGLWCLWVFPTYQPAGLRPAIMSDELDFTCILVSPFSHHLC